MEVNPIMSGILAIVVFLLGLVIKRTGWHPTSRQMVIVITVLAIVLGLLQALIMAQLEPLPAIEDPSVPWVVFVYVVRVLAWFSAQVGLILSISQGIYFAIQRLLLGNA